MAELSTDMLVRQFDLNAHIIADKMASSYEAFIKRELMSRLHGFNGLRVRELRALMCIHFLQGAVTSADIVEMLGFDPATVSRAVKRLMDADMIEGSQDNRDTRMIRLTLTDRGIDIAEQYEDLSARAFMAVNSRLTSGLTSTEKVALLSAMEKMLQRSTLLSGLRLEDDIFEAQEPLRVRKAAPGR